MEKVFSYEDFKKLLKLAETVEEVNNESGKEEVLSGFEKIINTFKDKKNKSKIEEDDKDGTEISIDLEYDDDDIEEDVNHYRIILNIDSPIELSSDHINDIADLVEDYIAGECIEFID